MRRVAGAALVVLVALACAARPPREAGPFREPDLVELVTLDPTMTTYMSGRDLVKRRTAEWHETYTLPSLWDFYTPNRENHGAYFYNWTTWDEVAWKKFYQVWMEFINDYKNMGGRVTPSTDAGFIYNTYGFSYIEELENFQEAGFHPLEVIRAGTPSNSVA